MDKKVRHIDFSFGTSLRNAREKRNYKREQIAERAEISPRFLAAIESGRRKPSLDVLIRLVNAIGALLMKSLRRRRTQTAKLLTGSDGWFHNAASGIRSCCLP